MPFYEQPKTIVTDIREPKRIGPAMARLLEDQNLTDVSDLAYADVHAIAETLGKRGSGASEIVFFARNQFRLSCPECDALNLLYSPDRDHLGQGLPTPIECYYCEWEGSRTEVRAQQIANYVTEIQGVGPATADQLADAFGTVWRIVEAEPEELAEETRLSDKKATEVHAHLCENIHPELDPRDDESDQQPTIESHAPSEEDVELLVGEIQQRTQLDREDAEWYSKATCAFRAACPDDLQERVYKAAKELSKVRERINALKEERKEMHEWTTMDRGDGEEVPIREFAGDENRRDEISDKLHDELTPRKNSLQQTISEELDRFYNCDEFRFDTKKEAIVAARAVFDQELSEPVQGVKIARKLGCSTGYPSEFVLEQFESGSAVIPKEYVRKRTTLSDAERRSILERDNRQCVRCDSSRELEVHHIIPVSDDGSNKPDNLATLCHACHLDAHGGIMLSHDVIYDSREDFWDWTA